MPSNRKPTPAESAKLQAMDKQFDALQAETYRITCIHAVEDQPPINIGKGKAPGGEEKFYTAEEVKRKVGLLSAKNVNGYNIYITPIDSQRHYMVIDDLDSDKLRQFQDWGYRPALVQKSSEDSIQAVSILQKADVSHGAGNALFKKLNRRVGDPNISGFVHPFRLAGFGNKKPSRQVEGKSPFVKVVHAHHTIDQKAVDEAQTIDAETELDGRQAKASVPVSSITIIHEEAGDIDVAAARSWYQRRVDFWADKADLSKIDRELARRLRKQGYAEGAAQEIIRAASPDIATRHPRTAEYLKGKTADLYQQPAEPRSENSPPRPAPAGAAPKPR